MNFLFGTATDSYINLRSIVLILGMMFIVQVCISSGMFHFLALKIIQMTSGKPIKLLLILCSLSVFLSAIINNILAIIVLIPITITISRILNINPAPFIITEAILVNIGGMMFPISSIPNILISSYADIFFLEFFINVGLFALIVFGITILIFFFKYRKSLIVPKKRLREVLEDFNPWNYVPDKQLFYKSSFILLLVFSLFIIIPPDILSPDMIALTGGVVLVVTSRLNSKDILDKIDFELLLFLLGIFIITGALELVGVIEFIGNGLMIITGGNLFITILVILWVSAFLSSSIDNIPLTKVLIPVVDTMTQGFSYVDQKLSFYSLAYGANLGDNLTPLGDNVLVMSIAEKHERPITYKEFFKLGFIATIIQLLAVSLYFTLLTDFFIGLFIIIFIFISIFSILLFRCLNIKFEKNYMNLLSQIKERLSRARNIKNSKYLKLFFKKVFKKIKHKIIKKGVKIGTKKYQED